MAVYSKNGRLHSHFNQSRADKYDDLGRRHTSDFWQAHNWTVADHDKEISGQIIFNNCDQIATQDGRKPIYVESAVKSTRLWKWIKDGVDVEDRKLKYFREGEEVFICMSNDEGDEMLVIPMKGLQMAEDDCDNQWYGHGGVLSSEGFTMPEHGCHRVRKRCRRGYQQTGEIEDFYRIPYKYIRHYKLQNGGWKLVHKPEEDFLWT